MLSRLFWRWQHYEVLILYGYDDAQGMPSGGSEWVGLYFTFWGARRAAARQRFRPERMTPQQVSVFELPKHGAPKELVWCRWLLPNMVTAP